MIQSFADKEAEKVWEGKVSAKLPPHIQNVARRKLRMLNNAQNISDLKVPPANRLEKLAGNLSGKFSIRINNQWRVTFRWEEGNAFDVQIIDYHR
jgi:proteic killer suppression protein